MEGQTRLAKEAAKVKEEGWCWSPPIRAMRPQMPGAAAAAAIIATGGSITAAGIIAVTVAGRKDRATIKDTAKRTEAASVAVLRQAHCVEA
mmetsp:Transcript_42105/g.73887  ORF Transcript_42105/g.73887 Transcript_42105/m.73887 type:complete len:91 (-) Transcript_42105:511-783(-)